MHKYFSFPYPVFLFTLSWLCYLRRPGYKVSNYHCKTVVIPLLIHSWCIYWTPITSQPCARHPCQEFNGEQNRAPTSCAFGPSGAVGKQILMEELYRYASTTLISAMKEKLMQGFWGSNVWVEIRKMDQLGGYLNELAKEWSGLELGTELGVE